MLLLSTYLTGCHCATVILDTNVATKNIIPRLKLKSIIPMSWIMEFSTGMSYICGIRFRMKTRIGKGKPLFCAGPQFVVICGESCKI